LKNFALRDLGILRTNKNANPSARCTDEAEARACFHFSRLLNQLELKSDDIYRNAVAAILGGSQCTAGYAADMRDKAVHREGLYFERHN
jgi:DNA polymerase-3 subunit epsilon